MCKAGTRLTGFVTSDGCTSDGSRVLINYHSMNSFQSWFQEVIAADSDQLNDSLEVTVNVVEFSPRVSGLERVRCVGTLITHFHLLATASCVNLEENSIFAIGVEAQWDTNWSLTIREPEEIFIHPNFNANNPMVANIAVLRVRLILLSFPWIFVTFIIFLERPKNQQTVTHTAINSRCTSN